MSVQVAAGEEHSSKHKMINKKKKELQMQRVLLIEHKDRAVDH
jgi:hypothetical protein